MYSITATAEASSGPRASTYRRDWKGEFYITSSTLFKNSIDGCRIDSDHCCLFRCFLNFEVIADHHRIGHKKLSSLHVKSFIKIYVSNGLS